MPSKTLLFEFKADTATFRVADTEPPLEEVSVVGSGRFKGKNLTTLYTIRISPTKTSKDRHEGAGILYLEGGGRSTYRMKGTLISTPKWREVVTGTMALGDDANGDLRELKNLTVSYKTLVDANGKSSTKVWK